MKRIDEAFVTKSLLVLSTAGALLLAPGKHATTALAGAAPACADGVCCPSPGPVCSVNRHAYANYFYWDGDCS